MDILDPIKFQKKCWPHIKFYDKQKEIIYSVIENAETFVPAGHQLGKDFVSGFIAIYWVCSRRPARVVTTSVKHDQLNDVLWGEIRNFLDSSVVDLPLQYNHMRIRQIRMRDKSFVPKGELVGQVVAQGEGLLGRHLPSDIPRTLTIFDEASGIPNMAYESSDTWSHSKLIISNPYPCENFLKVGVEGGDLVIPSTGKLRRKVIQIKAQDSPNVKLAIAEIKAGLRKPEPGLILTDDQYWGEYSKEEYEYLVEQWEQKNKKNPPEKIIVPGVLGFNKYLENRFVWDRVQQTVRLDAEFYKGAEVMMFPITWLDAAEEYHRELLEAGRQRVGRTIGVDSAQGGDNTSWAVCDDYGLLELVSKKTPDTSVIPTETIELMRKYNVKSENVLFDAGGGGKQHADILRSQGYLVRLVGFGEGATSVDKYRKGSKSRKQKTEVDEVRYVYKNRRAEMYGLLRLKLDPTTGNGFTLPESKDEPYKRLRDQLRKVPLTFDSEGRLYLLPKNKKTPDSNDKTLTELLGCSPDEADALALAVFGLLRKPTKFVAKGL